ncbi:MAG: restriction endonuclease, partial [Arcobacteraceae bacterium]|nr:restriction endonuclease [Arcobacteraceae bacterium]
MNNVIYEYQEVKSKDLTNYIIDTPSLHKYFKQDWGKLKARQYCGIINHNGEDFYILPKIANNDNSDTNLNIFIYMLIYSNDINIKNEDLASAQNYKSNNILEVFIQIFAKNLFKELQKGIYKEYITEQDNLTVLRGKYLINENLKYNFIKSKIYCEFDEFSMDNELNQFFLYAIKTLMNYTKNKKLLKMCELVFDDVSYKKFDIDNLNIHFNRLNNRFKDSFEFALLLLKKSIPMFEKDKRSFAFLFNMDKLFEKFMENIYKSIDNTTKLQYTRYFGNLKLRPDIVCDNLIIDVKYKLAKDKGDLKRDDKYQMFVYGTNFTI